MTHEHQFNPDCEQCRLRVSNVVTLPGDLDPLEQRCIDHIRDYGCHIVHVLPDEQDDGFSYSVGLYARFGHPEIVVFGQKETWRAAIINAISDGVQAGKRYASDRDYDDLIANYVARFRDVPLCAYPEFFGWAIWYYNRFLDLVTFPVLQCVWPDMQSRWPWNEGYEAGYSQPVLDMYDWISDGDRMRPIPKNSAK